MKILLEAGANPEAQDAQHWRTALHTAAMANDVELVKASLVISSVFILLDYSQNCLGIASIFLAEYDGLYSLFWVDYS